MKTKSYMVVFLIFLTILFLAAHDYSFMEVALGQNFRKLYKKIPKESIPLLSFTNIANDARVADDNNNSLGVAWSVAWRDYINKSDPDEYLDLFVANSNAPNRLFINNRVGTLIFDDKADDFGIDNDYPAYGVAWADIDNDGFLDCCVTSDNGVHVYRNTGGTFEDIAERPANSEMLSITNGRGVAWADINNDALVDLYVVVNGGNNILYINNGNYTFTDIAPIAHVTSPWNSESAAWRDFDIDGDLDLFVGSGGGEEDVLYRNDSDLDHDIIEFTSDYFSGTYDERVLGVAWGDYNGDGYPDLYVAKQNRPNKLYHNNGNGTFSDIASSFGMDFNGESYGCDWADFDYDGDLDLYVAVANAQNCCYVNNGDGTFTYTIPTGLTDSDNSRCISWGDSDNDGDLDLYVSNYGSPNRLFQNNGTESDYLILEAIGGAESIKQAEIKKVRGNNLQLLSNRAGIGARIKIVTLGPGPSPDTLVQIREVSGGSGYMSQNSLPVEFGLGQAYKVDSLIIQWPSGNTQIFTDNIPINQTITIVENDSTIYTKQEYPPGNNLSNIRVVPNPYNVSLNAGMQNYIRFMELPPYCTIKIFTESGDLITTLEHKDGSGAAYWGLCSKYGKVIASGIYIAYIKVTEDYKDPITGTPFFRKGQNTTTKFIIIR